jgi:hypothetical protein
MKKLVLPIACALAMAALPAKAQVRVNIDIGLPIAPPLVVVQPGVQVVEGFREEVFFVQGWYWCRRPDGWYRARRPRERFIPVEQRRVPGSLRRVPEGRYRNWHHEGPHGRPEGRPTPPPQGPRDRHDDRHDRRDKDDRGHREH